MKIATWNVNSLKVRLPHVLDWLAANQPDALCLQELKCENKAFPLAEIEAAGYQSAIERPSPAPPVLESRASSKRLNFSNILLSCSCGIVFP